jgi:hypothetical protein
MRLSRKAVIQFINGLFGVNHPLNSILSYPNTEYITPDLKYFISDMVIVIGNCKYHIEAQVGDDLNMAVRVFRYGFEESLRGQRVTKGEINLSFPQVRVIYWETTRKTPDKLTLNLIFPDGKRHKYQVKTFKFLDHSIAELEQQKMSILLPFYVLKLRKQVRAAKTGKRLQELSKEMEVLIDELMDTAERCVKNGVLERGDLLIVLKDMDRLYSELYQGYNEFKEADKMLQKKILHPAEEWKMQILQRERRKNQKERLREKLEIAQNMKTDGLSAAKIAAYISLPIEEIEKL